MAGVGLGDVGTALANGRFPGAYQLVVRGPNAAIGTSFGVITSSNLLSSTRWACERALSYDPSEKNDLGLAFFDQGTLLVSGPRGLTHSMDNACTNAGVDGIVDRWMSDVTADTDGISGLALARGSASASGLAPELFETTNRGATWALVTKDFPNDFEAFTVDAAPSNPNRVYVSGNTVGPDNVTLVGLLLVSDDRGRTFTARTIPGEFRPFIAAMDPNDSNVVYVRTLRGADDGNLLVTRDGGNTFQTIANLHGVPQQFYGVTGVAVSPDGTRVAYGSVDEGLFILQNSGAVEKVNDLPVMCLAWTVDGLYACSAPNLCGPFFVGRSNDEGRTFTAVLPSLDVQGDQTNCPEGTPVATACVPEWPAVEARLGGCNPAQPDAGQGAADAGLDSTPRVPPSIGCDCTVGHRSNSSHGASLGGLIVIIATACRRLVKRRAHVRLQASKGD